MAYEVTRYEGGRDAEIAEMVLRIQNDEQGLELSLADQPDLENIANAYGEGGFWTAVHEGRIVGTIGLLRYGPRQGALKKMFVAKEHRGPNGPAQALFERLLAHAQEQGIAEIFLDTPAAATRSHAFYRRVGFEPASRSDLPASYRFPDRDSLVFRLRL